MPYWFQFSKNARKDTQQNKNKKYAEPNNSTMNRICRAFDDIGKINFNYAGIPQFNYQMLLAEPCVGARPEIYQLFCELDSSNKSSIIESQESAYTSEKQLINNYAIVAEDITREITERFGSLEEAYPYIVKYLFTGDNEKRSAHKQMFWRVFGDIALKILKDNLSNCDSCPSCGMKIPAWVVNHQCVKNTKGFFECVDCHKLCERVNAKQCRCDDCQIVYRREKSKLKRRSMREKQKETKEKRTLALQSSSTGT